MNLFGHVSMKRTTWLLDVQRTNIELALTHGLRPNPSPSELHPYDHQMLQRIPHTTTTIFGWLQIDPTLTYMNCCADCFALYPLESAPPTCNHRISSIPGGLSKSVDANMEMIASGSNSKQTEIKHDFSEKVCGQRLLHYARGKEIPVRRYAFQSLPEWIARLLLRPSIDLLLDESLEESIKPFDPTQPIKDIHQSKIWKEFRGADGKQFTATSGNLIFAMFVDGINPFGNKQSGRHVSITFIVLICLTPPFHMRYKPENIFLVGIVPGPREPSLEQINWVLKPIVTQLQSLWQPGILLSQTHKHKNGRLIKAALLPFLADIPALRRCLGFPAATATHFCSYCLIKKPQIRNFESSTWPVRTSLQHKKWAIQARDADTKKAREKIFKTHGVRYSVLVDLEYWDIINYHVVDSMHNLLLGLLAWHCQRFWSMKEIDNDEDTAPSVSTVELLDLLAEHSNPPPPGRNKTPNRDVDDELFGENLMDILLTDNEGSSDADFDPLGEGWN